MHNISNISPGSVETHVRCGGIFAGYVCVCVCYQMSLKDIRLSSEFRHACRQEVQQHCRQDTTKKYVVDFDVQFSYTVCFMQQSYNKNYDGCG